MSTPHDSTDDSTQPKPAYASFRFLVLNLLLTTLLLIAFRYSIPTNAHMRYLYIVAESTAAVLNLTGVQGDVEGYRKHYSETHVRTELNEWDLGHHANPDPAEPLSAWEFWRHSAEKKLRQEGDLTNHGPRVRYITDANPPKRLFHFRIVPDCGAIPSMAILLSAIVLVPGAWRRKLAAVGVGVSAVYTVNVLRLVGVSWVGAYDQTQDKLRFAFVHEHFWPAVLFVFLAALWIAISPTQRETGERFRAFRHLIVAAAIALPVVWLLWWKVLPGYAWILGQVSATIINASGTFNITALRTITEPFTFLNADTLLVFESDGREFPYPIAPLVAGLPAFVVLMLCASRISMKRRLSGLSTGVCLLFAGQIAFVACAFIFRQSIGSAPEIPTALGLLLMTLPFALWITYTWPELTSDSETPTPVVRDS